MSKTIIITPQEIGQGGVGLLKVHDNNKGNLEITWNKRNISLIPGVETNTHFAFIGVDLTLKPGRYKVKKRTGYIQRPKLSMFTKRIMV